MRTSFGPVMVVVVSLMVLQTSAQPTTTPCRMIKCAPDCAPGTGTDGCPTCDCPPSCQNVVCDRGSVCELHEVQCFTTPCYPQPTCVSVQDATTPANPNATTKSCNFGILCRIGCTRRQDSNGCPYCDCPPTCETVRCREGYVCKMQEEQCRQPRCTSSPACVPIISCTEAPNTRRCGRLTIRWTYNSTSDTCQKFPYYGCTSSPNTFLTPKACEDSCKTKEPICIATACANTCFTLRRKNKCPKCICPNPCKGIRCLARYECQLRESTFFKEKLLPFCAPKTTGPV